MMTTINSNKRMIRKYSGVSALLMTLTLGSGLMRAEEPTPTQEKPNAQEGRFIDAHVHFHDRNAGDLDKVAEWMKANNWWRSITDGSCGRLLETNPNLYADISCTVGRSPIGKDKPMAREFFIRHADKLLFGTDSGWWSLGKDKKQAGEFALIDELKLPKEVEDKICRGNAERLFWSKK
jgi:predicted TIM-barrel fold metal-dependent hydrolase